MVTKYPCPVCNYWMDDPPLDWHHCPCCGTEFEYSDAGTPYSELRAAWIASGMQWWSPARHPPKGWDPMSQVLPMFAIRSVAAAEVRVSRNNYVGNWKKENLPSRLIA